ncbi:hypothetical protein [Arthrobacter sp. efr-133-R2A-120]|uniref:hypothetical protein n=1 Tax=Arthrobacter sp. efr-133-R2A-120 TaxID=3040277 RepID=UPI00254E4D12|nr:hypothetical protein [Arthrobacter sp. efr-133-R2A-120]
MDSDDPPTYWGGREALAHALGHTLPPADAPDPVAAEQSREKAYRAVKRALKSLHQAGAVKTVTPASFRRHAVYEIMLQTGAEGSAKGTEKATPKGTAERPPKGTDESPIGYEKSDQRVRVRGPHRSTRNKEEQSLDDSTVRPRELIDQTALTRPEITELCDKLADLIQGNGSKRPAITKAWLTSARLLIENDKRELREAHHVIEWCQQDSFWKSNILSMPKLREKYDQLRLKAGTANHAATQGPWDPNFHTLSHVPPQYAWANQPKNQESTQ